MSIISGAFVIFWVFFSVFCSKKLEVKDHRGTGGGVGVGGLENGAVGGGVEVSQGASRLFFIGVGVLGALCFAGVFVQFGHPL